ncbi:MAG: lactate utilization protein [Syntrophaceae bacterium]|nr:lactate utilization protein [Syntrophaceae bacterium]
MNGQIKKILSSLHSRHIPGIVSENSKEAILRIMGWIPRDAVVGIGDSTTIRQLRIPEALKERGNRVLDPFEAKGPLADPKDALRQHKNTLTKATVSDIFLTGTNAITQDGKLVNVDAVGNRVAGMVWGHPTSIIVIGRNKIVKDVDEAFYRIRKIIAPNHVRIRSVELGGRKSKTPCAVTGKCNDCRARDRVCNIFTIIEGKPFFTDLKVVFVNEDLGLSWDPTWPKDRIMQIVENYKKSVWIPVGNEN